MMQEIKNAMLLMKDDAGNVEAVLPDEIKCVNGQGIPSTFFEDFNAHDIAHIGHVKLDIMGINGSIVIFKDDGKAKVSVWLLNGIDFAKLIDHCTVRICTTSGNFLCFENGEAASFTDDTYLIVAQYSAR